MKHLPAELARYIRDTYSENWVEGQYPKIGGETLSWAQIVDLCARVQPSQTRVSQGVCHTHGCVEAHLEVFNAMEIVCPGVPGQVNGTRVHRASTSIRYGTCIVCSEHAFDSPWHVILHSNTHVHLELQMLTCILQMPTCLLQKLTCMWQMPTCILQIPTCVLTLPQP